MQNEEVQTQKICLWNGIFCTELPIEFQVADEKLIKKKVSLYRQTRVYLGK